MVFAVATGLGGTVPVANAVDQDDFGTQTEIPSDDAPMSDLSSPGVVDQTVPVATEDQPEESIATPAAPKSRLIEEVIVTAQKREEYVQDIPISISAYSGDQLQAMGINTADELQTVVPGLAMNNIAGFTLIYLRGIGTNGFLPSVDPSVATYVDGLYIPTAQNFITNLGGVERVEVLKGPQGTLFGRSATGGAISVVTRTPTFDTEASVQVEVGNLGLKSAQGFLNYPFGDNLAVAVSGIYNYRDAYHELVQVPGSVYPDPDYSPQDDETRGGRIRVRWLPLDTLDLMITGYKIETDGPGSLDVALKHPSLLATVLGMKPTPGDYEVASDNRGFGKVSTESWYGNVFWQTSLADIKVLYGDQSIQTTASSLDFDASPAPLAAFSTINGPADLRTIELQLVSNQNSWGSDWMDWVIGFYRLDQTGGYDPANLGLAGATSTESFDPLLGLLTPDQYQRLTQEGLLGLLPDSLLGQLPSLPGPGILLGIHGILDTDSTSGFFQTSVHFTDWLGLTLGARYQEESRFLTKQYVGVQNGDGSTTRLLQWHQPEIRFDTVSPKASLNFTFEDLLVYLSWARAHKSGTYNLVSIYTPPSVVSPETVTAYEIGLKGQFFGGAVRLNAAVFDNEIDDLQVQFISLLAGGAITFENAAEAHSRGAEADVQWLPLIDTNPGLVLLAGVSYLDSRYDRYDPASGFSESTGLYFKNGDFSGNRIARTPKWSGNLGLNQTLETASGPVELAVDVYFNGGFYFTAQNSAVDKQDAYTLVDARASWLYERWNTRLTLFGKNLGDTVYSAARFTNDFGTNYTYAPPRTYGLRINWDFY